MSFALPLALYAATAARTVQGGDAGEFGLIGMVGGVAHPPGYPLYSLLARTMGFLPIDPPFFRIALTSALCGAAAVAVLQRMAWHLTGSVSASLLTAFALGLSAVHWRLSGVPEVFSLHALVAALILLCTLRVLRAESEAPREMFWLGLVFGLGVSNHLTIIFCAPLGVAALYAVRRAGGDAALLKALAFGVAGGALGLTPYLLLMGWGRLDPTQAWIWGNTTTVEGLLHHFLRKDYGTTSLQSGGTGDGRYWLGQMGLAFLRQYVYAFALAAVAGAVLLPRKHRVFAAGAGGSLLLAGVLFPLLMNLTPSGVTREVAERFFLMPLILCTPFVAFGIVELQTRAERLPLTALLGATLVLGAVLAYPHVNWRTDPAVERYLVATVKPVPPRSIIIGVSDTTMPGMGWVNRVLHIRPDVHYIDPNMLGEPWYYERIIHEIPGFPLPFMPMKQHSGELGHMLAGFAPVYVIAWAEKEASEEGQLEPAGLLYRIGPPGPSVDPEKMEAMLERDMKEIGDLPEPVDAWSANVRHAIIYPWSDVAEAYKSLGRTKDYERVLFRTSKLIPLDDPGDLDEDAATDGPAGPSDGPR